MRTSTWLASGLIAIGLGLLAHGAYIPAKALVAQWLLESAWQRTLSGDSHARPWQWADTWPIVRLRQARLGVDQIVLAGASGRVLAFAPGHVTGTTRPGEPGNVVLSGHRDTHFRWLARLQPGDELQLQLGDGRLSLFRVSRRAVHHQDDGYLLDPQAWDGLRLITCYPFDSLNGGGDLRYVVDASPLNAPLAM